MPGFPDHIVDAAFGPDALAATHRRAEQQREQHPRWLAGLIARHGEPVTYQPEPITLGASRFQTWAWVGCGVQVEQTLTTWTVSAHHRGHLAKLAGLERYPTDAEISGVVALAGLDDAPGERDAQEPVVNRTKPTVDLSDLYSALDSASTVMALSSQDWGAAGDFAWLYGIFVGWDDDPTGGDVDQSGSALDELAARFHWDADEVAGLRRLRAAVAAFDINAVVNLGRSS